jgi:dihydrofolate reductase
VNTPKHFKAIAAMAPNRVIGQGRRIPWHLPEDFRWFKQTTMGQVLIMGRKTFESIGRPLPGRETVVLSRGDFSYPGVRVVHDLSELEPDREPRDLFICGGAQVYALALPLCSDLYLTRVRREVDGDVFFPAFEEQFTQIGVLLETADFQVVHYRNHRLLAGGRA